MLFALASKGFAQSDESRSYSKARIYLNDHNVLKVKDLKINGMETSFLNINNKKKEELSMNKVNFIKKKKGSFLWEGAVYGGASTALSALLIDADKDSLRRTKDFGAKEYIGFTLIGAGLGALIGSLFPKWEDAYSDGKFIGQYLPIKMNFEATHDLALIKITIPL